MKASSAQVGGDHYKNYAIQPAEFIQKNELNWCEGNAIKYLVRHRHKKGAEDIDKAIHYLQLLKEWEYGETAREAMQPLPESVTGEQCADTCGHFDGTICMAYSPGNQPECCRCEEYVAYEKVASPSPLAPVFALITEEYHRSLAEHTPWEEAGHSADTMLKVIKAEVAEVDIALSMGDYDEAVKELIHVGNVAVKAIVELTRRGRL